jgi:hypothetical protein
MARLALLPHAPSSGTGQRPGKTGIKGLQHRLPQALRTEGPGVDGKSVPGPRFFSVAFSLSGPWNHPPPSTDMGGSGRSRSSIRCLHRKLQDSVIPQASIGVAHHPSQNLLRAHRRQRHRSAVSHSRQDGLLLESKAGLILESASDLHGIRNSRSLGPPNALRGKCDIGRLQNLHLAVRAAQGAAGPPWFSLFTPYGR